MTPSHYLVVTEKVLVDGFSKGQAMHNGTKYETRVFEGQYFSFRYTRPLGNNFNVEG